MHLLGGEHLTGLHLQVFARILPRRGMGMAWNSRSRAYSGTAARGATLHQEELTAWDRRSAVGQFCRAGRAWVIFLRTTVLAARIRRWALGCRSPPAVRPALGVAVQVRLKASFTTPDTKAELWRDDSRSFGLPGELRVLHLDGEDVGAAIPDVFRGQLAPQGKRLRNSQNSRMASSNLAQAVDMGATERGGNEVHKGIRRGIRPLPATSTGPVHRRLLGA